MSVRLAPSRLAQVPEVDKGMYYPPTLVTNVSSTSTLVQQEIFGPVITMQVEGSPVACSLARPSLPQLSVKH